MTFVASKKAVSLRVKIPVISLYEQLLRAIPRHDFGSVSSLLPFYTVIIVASSQDLGIRPCVTHSLKRVV